MMRRTATSGVETFPRLVSRSQLPGLLATIGAAFALASIIYSWISLHQLDRAIQQKRVELGSVEARTANTIRALEEAESALADQRKLLKQVTTSLENKQVVSSDVLREANASIVSGTAVSAELQRELMPAVGIVIADESERPQAERLRIALRARGFRVKYVLSLGSNGVAPEQTEVRHFKAPTELRQAPELVQLLRKDFGVNDVNPRFANDPTTPPNDYEIWLSKHAFSSD